jgi:hypothetical protein
LLAENPWTTATTAEAPGQKRHSAASEMSSAVWRETPCTLPTSMLCGLTPCPPSICVYTRDATGCPGRELCRVAPFAGAVRWVAGLDGAAPSTDGTCHALDAAATTT